MFASQTHENCTDGVIAGHEIIDGSPGAWIRPVSNRQSQEVSEYERQYQDGSDPKLLDVIDIPLLEHKPSGHQQENWLLDPEQFFASWGTKKRVQAHFRFDSSNYKLWVTDPCIEQAYLAKRDGFYRLDKCYLTVSLGELFKGYHHKLIAAILEEPL